MKISLSLAILIFTSGCDIGIGSKYPIKDIKLVVQYPAGGSTHIAAENLVKNLPGELREKIRIVNQPGAGGVTGSIYVAEATNDGYTLIVSRSGSHAVAPAMKAKEIPYSWESFTYLGLLELNPIVCATGKHDEFPTIEDLLSKTKENPSSIIYSSSGIGATLHIATLALLNAAGIEDPKKVNHIPYKGDAAAVAQAVHKQVDFVCSHLSPMYHFLSKEDNEEGRLKGLLVLSDTSLEEFPDIPSSLQKNLLNLETIVGWSGLAGPKALDETVIKFWDEQLNRLKENKAWLNVTKSSNSIPRILNSTESTKFVEQQVNNFTEIVKILDK